MKKILPILVLSALLLVPGITIGTTYAPAENNLESAVDKIVNLFFTLLIIVSVILFVWGGVVIVSSGGEADKVNQGKNIILYAVIGILVAFISKALAGFLTGYLTTTTK